LAHSGCRDRALLVLGSNTAKHAALTALLDHNWSTSTVSESLRFSPTAVLGVSLRAFQPFQPFL
jgi:hypothetical protein